VTCRQDLHFGLGPTECEDQIKLRRVAVEGIHSTYHRIIVDDGSFRHPIIKKPRDIPLRFHRVDLLDEHDDFQAESTGTIYSYFLQIMISPTDLVDFHRFGWFHFS
jgi:hypothetical protein